MAANDWLNGSIWLTTRKKYRELGVLYLAQMRDDYTTNSHCLPYAILFKMVGRMHFLNLGVKGLSNLWFVFHLLLASALHRKITEKPLWVAERQKKKRFWVAFYSLTLYNQIHPSITVVIQRGLFVELVSSLLWSSIWEKNNSRKSDSTSSEASMNAILSLVRASLTTDDSCIIPKRMIIIVIIVTIISSFIDFYWLTNSTWR